MGRKCIERQLDTTLMASLYLASVRESHLRKASPARRTAALEAVVGTSLSASGDGEEAAED